MKLLSTLSIKASVGCSWWTHWPREVCTSRVTSVEVAGHTQFRANMAYLNSSSHTTWSESINTNDNLLLLNHESTRSVTVRCPAILHLYWKPNKNWQKHLTCKLDMEFIFWFEYLNVEWAAGGKVLNGPCSEDSLMVLKYERNKTMIWCQYIQERF